MNARILTLARFVVLPRGVCGVCAGRGWVVGPAGTDACWACAARAEAEWRLGCGGASENAKVGRPDTDGGRYRA